MASPVTAFAQMLRCRDENGAMNMIKNWKVVTSVEVKISGEKNLLLGTVLHISKGKKVQVGIGREKKIRKELPYFRLFFIR